MVSAGFTLSRRNRGGRLAQGRRAGDTTNRPVGALRGERTRVAATPPARLRSLAARWVSWREGAVAARSLAIFTRQFAMMMDAGVPLVQCLHVLGNQERDPHLATAILAVRTEVEGGSELASAMRRHPRAFDSLYTNMIAAGESGGILDTILARLAACIEANVKLRRQVRSAMTYPLAVIVIAVVVVGVILWKVIPTFAALFEGLGATLPLPTRLVVAASDALVTLLPVVLLATVGGIAALRWYRATSEVFG